MKEHIARIIEKHCVMNQGCEGTSCAGCGVWPAEKIIDLLLPGKEEIYTYLGKTCRTMDLSYSGHRDALANRLHNWLTTRKGGCDEME